MNAWELWTRIAIAVLELGSIAVFAWFLVEVVRLARARHRRPPEADGGDESSPDGRYGS